MPYGGCKRAAPGDDFSTAILLSFDDQTFSDSIGTSDVSDYFRFQTEQPGTFTLTVTYPGTENAGVSKGSGNRILGPCDVI